MRATSLQLAAACLLLILLCAAALPFLRADQRSHRLHDRINDTLRHTRVPPWSDRMKGLKRPRLPASCARLHWWRGWWRSIPRTRKNTPPSGGSFSP